MSAEEITGQGDEPKVLRARSFEDLVHGFTTRLGGVSQGPYASLNLGNKVGDDPALVARNHEIAAPRAGSRRRIWSPRRNRCMAARW